VAWVCGHRRMLGRTAQKPRAQQLYKTRFDVLSQFSNVTLFCLQSGTDQPIQAYVRPPNYGINRSEGELGSCPPGLLNSVTAGQSYPATALFPPMLHDAIICTLCTTTCTLEYANVP
jgi:hypothetical protein